MAINIRKHNEFKVVVGGHFGAGKTTFIKTLAQGDFLSSERRCTEKSENKKKNQTTVSMDFAAVEDGSAKFSIFGIPGQKRFDFMWEILAKGADGFILLLDSTDPTRWYELFRQVILFKKLNPDAVIIFAANKQDEPHALTISEIKRKLPRFADFDFIPVVATDYTSSLHALRFLKKKLLEKRKSNVNFNTEK